MPWAHVLIRGPALSTSTYSGLRWRLFSPIPNPLRGPLTRAPLHRHRASITSRHWAVCSRNGAQVEPLNLCTLRPTACPSTPSVMMLLSFVLYSDATHAQEPGGRVFTYAHIVTLASGSPSPPYLPPVCNITLLANEDADNRGGGRYTVSEPPLRRGGPMARPGLVERSSAKRNLATRLLDTRKVLKCSGWILSAWTQHAGWVRVRAASMADSRRSLGHSTLVFGKANY
ncbi:hypothetical protein GY45DRAFT_762431 [Cubamyces sp. BRFM 1775]|nr:hypothetical protein GY45DRAFT_762431 [Cubamyces sp. BRFM 1775]